MLFGVLKSSIADVDDKVLSDLIPELPIDVTSSILTKLNKMVAMNDKEGEGEEAIGRFPEKSKQ